MSFQVIPFIADRRAFDVIAGAGLLEVRQAGIAVDVRARQLRFVGRESRRQVARRINLAAQHAGDGQAAAGARIPGFNDGAGRVQPWHRHRAAGFQHHHRARIGVRDGGDQRVLLSGQRERLGVDAFGGPLRREDDGDVAGRRQRDRRGGVLAVVVADACLAARRQLLHWRGGVVDHWSGKMAGPSFGTTSPPNGYTCDEPPPDSTPTSAWPPMMAIDFSPAFSGSSWSRFFNSTMASSASIWLTLAWAAKSILVGSFWTGWSITPLANMLRTMRRAMSSMRASVTWPSCTASLSAAPK